MIREDLYDMTTGVKIHKQYVLPSIDLTISFVCGNGRTKRIQSGIFQKLHIFVFQVELYALNIFAFLSREPFDVTFSQNFPSRQLNRVFVVAAPAYYTN